MSSKQAMSFLNHPKGLFVLSFAEMFERISFYGLRSLLLLYMVNQLKYLDVRGYGVIGMYATLVYAAPLIGGYLADKILGFQRAVILGSLVIACGHLCMTISTGQAFFYAGLGLIISGTGLFKSNVSAMVGMLYDKEDQRKDAGYTLFYLGINFGGFLGPLICGLIAATYGWQLGFGVASLGMIVGAASLLAKRHHFSHIKQPENPRINLSAITMIGSLLAGPLFAGLIYANEIFSWILPFLGLAFLAYLLQTAFKSSKEERRHILILVVAIFLLMLSGAFVEQTALVLTLFIERSVDRSLFGWVIPTGFFHSIDPLTALTFGGIFSWIWMRLAAKNRDLEASTKYTIGFSLMALAYLIFTLVCTFGVQENGSIPWLYALIAMVFLSMGDICIYPVALSLCSKLSPRHMQGTLMGGVMMGVAFSQLIASILAKLASLQVESLESKVASPSALLIYKDLFLDLTVMASLGILLTFGVSLWMKKATKVSS